MSTFFVENKIVKKSVDFCFVKVIYDSEILFDILWKWFGLQKLLQTFDYRGMKF